MNAVPNSFMFKLATVVILKKIRFWKERGHPIREKLSFLIELRTPRYKQGAIVIIVRIIHCNKLGLLSRADRISHF